MRTVALGLQFDHPGLYPRNPVGKGYLVIPDSFDEVELPNLEDSRRLAHRRATDHAQARALVSAAFALVLRLDRRADLPRYLFMGLDAWFPPPDDSALPEVQRGFIAAGCAASLRRTTTWPPATCRGIARHGRGTPLCGQPVTLRGMHPEEPTISFTVPPAPSIEIEVESERFGLGERCRRAFDFVGQFHESKGKRRLKWRPWIQAHNGIVRRTHWYASHSGMPSSPQVTTSPRSPRSWMWRGRQPEGWLCAGLKLPPCRPGVVSPLRRWP